jgi:hypothetical protein
MKRTAAQSDAFIARNERHAEWGGGAVVFGLVVEAILAWLYRGHTSFIENWGPVFADCLIAGGVAAEILFARRANAELRLRTAEAELETQRLKAQFAWRGLSPDTMSVITHWIRSRPGSVTISYMANDPESQNIVSLYGFVFRLARWRVALQGISYAGPIICGIRVPTLDVSPGAEAALVIQTALSKAGIEWTNDPIPAWGSAITSGEGVFSKGAAMYVGPKTPPPFEE